jgi:hypothetical protein
MRVLKGFRDMYNLELVYKVGDSFICEDKARIENLINRGLIEGISPSINLKEKQTKKVKSIPKRK